MTIKLNNYSQNAMDINELERFVSGETLESFKNMNEPKDYSLSVFYSGRWDQYGSPRPNIIGLDSGYGVIKGKLLYPVVRWQLIDTVEVYHPKYYRLSGKHIILGHYASFDDLLIFHPEFKGSRSKLIDKLKKSGLEPHDDEKHRQLLVDDPTAGMDVQTVSKMIKFFL